MSKQSEECAKKLSDNANTWKADTSQVKTIRETLQIIETQKKEKCKP